MNEKVNSLVKKIFENILELKKIEPNFTWRNLLGDYGEYSAINNYGLIKAPSNCKDFDATTKEGKSVQIKSFKLEQILNLKQVKLTYF